MNNPSLDEYIIDNIKDEMEARKNIAIKRYIRELIPKYKLTDELRKKISKLVKENK